MQLTTLCYLEKNDSYLMLHRIKKKQDVNKGKWIGLGGHLEEGESPDECLVREIREESGLTLTSFRMRAVISFHTENPADAELMFLYTADQFEGELIPCNEGELSWVQKDSVLSLNLWEGDRIFLRLLSMDTPFFSLKLRYEKDRLCQAVLDGKQLELFDIRKEDGSCTGQTRERAAAHEDGTLHGTAHIFIVRRNSGGSFDVLLQKRSAEKDSWPGCYDISAAGHLSAGDSFEEGALRELYEELGIRAEAKDLTFFGFQRGHSVSSFRNRPFINNEIAAMYLYRKPVDDKLLTPEPKEIESLRWISLDELAEKAHTADPAYCLFPDEIDKLAGELNRAGIE